MVATFAPSWRGPIARHACVALPIRTRRHLVPNSPAVATGERPAGLVARVEILALEFPLGVSKFARRSIGAEPRDVIGARLLAYVPILAVGAMLTKPACVPGAVNNLIFGLDMKEGALGIRTRSKS
eukprot:gnl/Trimastix_PCT/1895.p2 GENE.gnl/Trimastix_PCT/1895~~gnl/Trimastix_PCT/1895.p2  ORF type:complete len:126 (+),score=1.75 gnl/Trimastix_PCT/1895:64-441(+)